MNDYIVALLGGCLIGAAASLLMLVNGRVAGISGIVAGLFSAPAGERSWRLGFLGGLAVAGIALGAFGPPAPPSRHLALLAVSGLLVGFGTRLGSGCTSGHGVCGLGRLSVRSLAATLTFMGTGMATTYVLRHLWGAAS